MCMCKLFPLIVGQVIAYFFLFMILIEAEGLDGYEIRNKRNVILLSIPLGYLYFVWIGIKKATSWVINEFKEMPENGEPPVDGKSDN